MSKKLYQWQEECLKRWFDNKGRGMVQAVTGTGKTFLALSALKRLDEIQRGNLRVKIVVPTGELMRQWEHAIKEYLIDSGYTKMVCEESRRLPGSFHGIIGLRGGGHKGKPDCKYMIYVINSARYELARQILMELRRGEKVFLIADECHHYVSGQNQLIFEFLPHLNDEEASCFFSLGLSATLPGGQARQYLESVLGRRIYTYGMKEAVEQGSVCEYDIYHIELKLLKEEREGYEELTDRMNILYKALTAKYPSLKQMGNKERFEMLRQIASGKDKKTAKTALGYMQLTFRRKNLVCEAGERIYCARSLIACLNKSEKILIFGERIRQAEELYEILQREYPERVGRYHSQMGQQANKNIVERFRAGDIRILITCRALDEGMDVPDVSVGIILSGTSLKRQRIQRMGRIIRKGKDRASLYYLHMVETAEDVCFLPNVEKGSIFEPKYHSCVPGFENPEYDVRAKALLEQMKKDGADSPKIKEALRCLALGRVRADWKQDPLEIARKIGEVRYTEDKNYWICMKKLTINNKDNKEP